MSQNLQKFSCSLHTYIIFSCKKKEKGNKDANFTVFTQIILRIAFIAILHNIFCKR